ncbi:phosphoribosyltransferase [Candidatus Kaiserbacteria bacterium]|nr:phosphoribosyltransferase [Candidatus Kaiserbacteria bacterium]
MEESRALELMERAGVLLYGHFVYTSGKHGHVYVNKDRIYLNPVICSELCYGLAEEFVDLGVEIVVGPEKGGIILSQLVALHMSELIGLDVQAAFAEKDGGGFILKRGYDEAMSGKKVAFVEDILNTGGSAEGGINAVRRCGGHVVAVGALWNRGGVTASMVGSVPLLTSLVNKPFEAWDESDMPDDLKKIPINTNVGKGKEYLAKLSQQTD